jgi:hypothetical protein
MSNRVETAVTELVAAVEADVDAIRRRRPRDRRTRALLDLLGAVQHERHAAERSRLVHLEDLRRRRRLGLP